LLASVRDYLAENDLDSAQGAIDKPAQIKDQPPENRKTELEALDCLRASNACRRVKFRRGIGLARLFEIEIEIEIEIELLTTRYDFDSDFDCDTDDHDSSV
jgi:hypothetical protein